MTMPAISAAASAPSAASSGHAEPRGQQRDHLARRGRGRVDPVARPAVGVRGVVVDEHARQPLEQRRGGARARRRADRACRSRRRRAGRSRPSGVGILDEPVHARQEVVERRHGVGGDERRAAAVVLDDRGDAERRAERVGVGVLVASRPGRCARAAIASAAAVGTASSQGRRSTVIGGLRAWRRARADRRPRRWRRRPAGRGASIGTLSRRTRRRAATPRPAAASAGRRRPRARRGAGARGSRAARVSSARTLQLRDAAQPDRATPARGGRTAWRARAPASCSSRSSGWPMTLTQTRAVARSGAVSTSVTVTNPIRGSCTSFARIAPISSRSS